MPVDKDIKKVLIIGSGPIVIGQAAEFDYSGTQACRALKNLGLDVVLVNSNPATIQTDFEEGWKVYLEPLVPEYIIPIIEHERPDALLPTMGGQTGLNLGIELSKSGVLESYGVKLIGSKEKTIEICEDREKFKSAMEQINEPVPKSFAVKSLEEALDCLKSLSFPVIIRTAFTLGGSGGGVASSKDEFIEIVKKGLSESAIGEVLIEESLLGYQEIEYEVMRDRAGNSIIVCAMENFDPMGIHTGDSIVVAPTQTLNDKMYQILRKAAIKIINHLNIEGGCNIQFAIKGDKYYVIEVNPRVSRSSALASKVTGYPIAQIAAQIAVGLLLPEIKNKVVKKLTAFFEPTVDYVVVKIPRWPFDKFANISREIGVQMKATGEAMAIGGIFEEAFFKALESTEVKLPKNLPPEKEFIIKPTDIRVIAILEALQSGYSIEEISKLSGISIFFLNKIKRALDYIKSSDRLDKDFLLKLKRFGFSDKEIAKRFNTTADKVKKLREKYNIKPVFNMVDTCAAEFEAETPYFYSTYNSSLNEADPLKGKKYLVIGSGPIRIGQGVEFDYCCVQCVKALKECGIKAIMVNNNPETVSTDFDVSDRLYFEPLTEEHILNIIENEKPDGVVVQFGGQTAINTIDFLERYDIKVAGTQPKFIRLAEDRTAFAKLLSELDIPAPRWKSAASKEEIIKYADELNFPVLVRPSFIIGGSGVELVYSQKDLKKLIDQIEVSPEKPVFIDEFLSNAVEVDVDAVSDGNDVFIGGIMEHIEEAGIHSGDSFCVIPPQNLPAEVINTIKDYTKKIANALNVIGLINIQYAIKGRKVYVIEANPRASRTVPFVSKVIKLPLTKIATKCIVGHTLKEMGLNKCDYTKMISSVAVKAPVFPFNKFNDLDPILGPKMQSTGEVIGLGKTFKEALYKAYLAAGQRLPKSGGILLSVRDEDKKEIVDIAKKLKDAGFKLYATTGTHNFLKQHNVKTERVLKISEGKNEITELILSKKLNLIINTPSTNNSKRDGFYIRRTAVANKVPYITTLKTAKVVTSIITDDI